MEHNGLSGWKWTERTEVDQNGPNSSEVDHTPTLKKIYIFNFLYIYIYIIYRKIVLGFFSLASLN